MRIFAQNKVIAKGKFWLMMKTKKLKKNNGEIIAIHEITENNLVPKNYGIWLRYNSRSGTHNMYKEFRDVSRVNAITKLYQDMAGRHRSRSTAIHIIDIKEIKSSDCRRDTTKQFLNNKIRFPLSHRLLRAPHKKAGTFLAKRPGTHFQ